MNKVIRQLYKGVSWRSPLINSVFKLIDIPDRAVRKRNGLEHLPPFSVRVRSRGISNQFGGQLFSEQGNLMVSLLEKYAGLDTSSNVLEIGCGCGCAAHSLVKYLTKGSYNGLDIDTKSIDFCRQSSTFSDVSFNFELIDVYSSQWNPDGKIKPEDFTLPVDDNSVDVVFLTSVFTHMLPSAVSRYIQEIRRVLKPGGRLLTTVFLSDDGREGASISFPYEFEGCFLHQLSYPERGVAYPLQYFHDLAQSNSLNMPSDPIKGNWRRVRADGQDQDSGFGQDIVVMRK